MRNPLKLHVCVCVWMCVCARMLFCFNKQPVYGCSSAEAGYNFQQTKEGDLYFVDDNEIDLIAMVTTDEVHTRPGTTSVKGISVYFLLLLK